MGCKFTVKFTKAGYSAVEPVVNWLESNRFHVYNLEANDSKFKLHCFSVPLSLQLKFVQIGRFTT